MTCPINDKNINNVEKSCCNHYKNHRPSICTNCPSSNCCSHDYCYHTENRWSQIPYPGQSVPYEGIEKDAGSWPLHFIKYDNNGKFYTMFDEKIHWNFDNPCSIDFNEELKEVENTQINLTPCQAGMAKFWGSGVPVQQWTPIVLKLIDTYKVNPPLSSRILAAVQCVISDAFTLTWYYKYLWDFARPVQINKDLVTLLNTPKFPTYPSGHSVVSGAASVILSYFFPSEAKKLNQLAQDASISRLYGGIHFRSDLSNGLLLGRQLGALAIEIIATEVDEYGKPIYKPYTEFLDAPIVPKYC